MDKTEYLKEENTESLTSPQAQKKSKISKNKRKFSDEQIRSLESIFESDTKLEPRKKLQIATELGLHPRQVAIWFQNRRARWKSKQIEQQLRILRASYEHLASQFERLKEEKKTLLIQIHKLGGLLQKPHDGYVKSKAMEGKRESSSLLIGDANYKTETKSRSLQDEMEDREIMHPYVDNGNSIRCIKDEEGCELQLTYPLEDRIYGTYNSIESQEKWYSLDSGGPFDQLCSSSEWLDFWT